nr:MAG TPA: hypothetical protein [Caudoviricetes sp.]
MPTTDELQSQINALQSQLNSILGMADDDYIHQYSGEEIDAGITAAGNAVRYDLAQSLTAAQQTQARGNIAAMQGISSPDYPGCYYVLNGSNVEWVNPPLALGVEYRTTERYLGKPVYTMAFSFGALPNASDKVVAMPGTDSTCKIIEIHGYASNEMTLPGVSGTSTGSQVTLTGVGNRAYVITGSDRSSATATIVVKYIKTTD